MLDPRSMTWFPWMAWRIMTAGDGFLSYCDAAGEKLAWWFGITSPKYYYEIQEALRMKVINIQYTYIIYMVTH